MSSVTILIRKQILLCMVLLFVFCSACFPTMKIVRNEYQGKVYYKNDETPPHNAFIYLCEIGHRQVYKGCEKIRRYEVTKDGSYHMPGSKSFGFASALNFDHSNSNSKYYKSERPLTEIIFCYSDATMGVVEFNHQSWNIFHESVKTPENSRFPQPELRRKFCQRILENPNLEAINLDTN